MTLILLSRVTPSLRGILTRWMLELRPGVFLGTMTARVRDRLWQLVVSRKRLGSCLLVMRAANEQGFVVVSAGDDSRNVTDFDGLSLVRLVTDSR